MLLSFGHSGANGGYQSLSEAYQELGQGFAVITDGAGGLRLIGELQRAVAEEYKWPDGRVETHSLADVDPSVLRRYTGVYLFSGHFKMQVTLDNGQLFLQYALFHHKCTLCNRLRAGDGRVSRESESTDGPEELDGEKVADVNP